MGFVCTAEALEDKMLEEEERRQASMDGQYAGRFGDWDGIDDPRSSNTHTHMQAS